MSDKGLDRSDWVVPSEAARAYEGLEARNVVTELLARASKARDPNAIDAARASLR
jgi:hypothetical protein